MVQWGGFIEQRDEEREAHKERHVAYWDENHDNPELELWRFETGFDHGWGAGNNEEDGELAEQRLQEHIDEHGGQGEGGHAWEYEHGYQQGLDAFKNFRNNNPDEFENPPEE
ncbi:hypothetical protein RhiXN_01660 [Rhizoctonia solani]|uniref:Uncharacterized protein n=1 Tax=Rhizoctonia solani TaxID=456999 RepID=A0A8H7HD25_9AGAM|nr:uncharacterized protein RhiXN_01660 [Rhizoctonia solani]KAF8682788.1 hypothetical protein RHS04_02689 [Rhizoctonia solani]QRW27065.1 hypothetical protein RhiXN_01660 [Rhizoctonia solani]